MQAEVERALESLPKSLTDNLDLDHSIWQPPSISNPEMLSTCIDHTLLKPDATKEDILKTCDEAKNYLFFSVCVNTMWVAQAKFALQNSEVKVATTVGFPLGAMNPKAKQEETRIAIIDGADEVDMVLNIGALKSQNYELVHEDIFRIKEICGRKKLKVILETGILSTQEILQASLVAKAAKADFLKTSTGFVPQGATEEAVKLLRRVAGEKMGVKASGGVRTTEQAIKMIQAGANRLGCSASIAIIGKGQSQGVY